MARLGSFNVTSIHVLYILEAVSQVADKRMVDMFEHATLSDDVPYALGSDDWSEKRISIVMSDWWSTQWLVCAPSSLRMYLSANERPVSFRSTIRTLPNAPRPTTRSNRKWFRFTIIFSQTRQFNDSIGDVDIDIAKYACTFVWVCMCVCLYLRRRTRRVCPGYYPLERPARPSISKNIRIGFVRD